MRCSRNTEKSKSASKRRFDSSLNLSARIQACGYENGLIFRAFADDILGLPPELEELFARRVVLL